MNLKLPKIYPITDTRISGLSHLEQVKRLADGGATFIQLRDKDASPLDFYNAAERAISFARERGITIIINDRVDIALTLKADGVHLGQDDLPAASARTILGPDAIIGLSTHSLDQVRTALLLPVDYIAIGPVFETSTKLKPDDVVGIDGVKKVRNLWGSKPLVAIGGVTTGNIKSVFNAGADSAAIIGGILSDPAKIGENFASLNRLLS